MAMPKSTGSIALLSASYAGGGLPHERGLGPAGRGESVLSRDGRGHRARPLGPVMDCGGDLPFCTSDEAVRSTMSGEKEELSI